MRLAPEVEAASKVDWQLFVTLTWRGQVPSPELRVRLLRQWLATLARLARVPFDHLVWFCREEGGEIGDRPHYHVLIAGLPCLLGFDFGYRMSHVWTGGFSEARIWCDGLGAVAYASKQGANIYEARKFRSDRPIMLSESLAKLVNWATGDNVDREDTEPTAKSEQRWCLVPAIDQQERDEVRKPGYLLAVNASRTQIRKHYANSADDTDGWEARSRE